MVSKHNNEPFWNGCEIFTWTSLVNTQKSEPESPGDERNQFQGPFHENQKSSTSASKWTTATNKCAARQNTLSYHLPAPI